MMAEEVAELATYLKTLHSQFEGITATLKIVCEKLNQGNITTQTESSQTTDDSDETDIDSELSYPRFHLPTLATTTTTSTTTSPKIDTISISPINISKIDSVSASPINYYSTIQPSPHLTSLTPAPASPGPINYPGCIDITSLTSTSTSPLPITSSPPSTVPTSSSAPILPRPSSRSQPPSPSQTPIILPPVRSSVLSLNRRRATAQSDHMSQLTNTLTAAATVASASQTLRLSRKSPLNTPTTVPESNSQEQLMPTHDGNDGNDVEDDTTEESDSVEGLESEGHRERRARRFSATDMSPDFIAYLAANANNKRSSNPLPAKSTIPDLQSRNIRGQSMSSLEARTMSTSSSLTPLTRNKRLASLEDDDDECASQSTIHEHITRQHMFIGTDNKIKLNVGGKIFSTTMATLKRDRQRNMLTQMFSGNFAADQDEEGAYFIDRDPTYFHHILNWLRDGNLFISSMSNPQKQALLREARFYQVQGLVEILEKDARQVKALMRRELSQEKEYKLCIVNDKEIQQVFNKMTLQEGYDFENWLSVPKGGIHMLFSKKLSRGELMLLDRLQNHM